MKEILKSKIWAIYDGRITQSITSAKTARRQLPKSFKVMKEMGYLTRGVKLMDIGCGNGNIKFIEALKQEKVKYFGCDPFNQPKKVNLNTLEQCANGQSDIVTINNVLNTIPEQKVWIEILKQARNAVSEQGIVVVAIYEGTLNSQEKEKKKNNKKVEMTPIRTRDGWQNRMKTEEYLEVVQSVFKHVRLVSKKGSKVIVASKERFLDD